MIHKKDDPKKIHSKLIPQTITYVQALHKTCTLKIIYFEQLRKKITRSDHPSSLIPPPLPIQATRLPREDAFHRNTDGTTSCSSSCCRRSGSSLRKHKTPEPIICLCKYIIFPYMPLLLSRGKESRAVFLCYNLL